MRRRSSGSRRQCTSRCGRPHSLLRFEHGAVDVERLVDHLRNRELARNPLRPASPRRARSAASPSKRLTAAASAAGSPGHQQPGFAIAVHELDPGPEPRRDDRLATVHRLQLDQTERFAAIGRRQHEHIAGRVIGDQLVIRNATREMHPGFDSAAWRPPASAIRQWPGTAENQLRIDLAHRADQHIEALVVDMTAQREKQRTAANEFATRARAPRPPPSTPTAPDRNRTA
jgi:hypothetical protein